MPKAFDDQVSAIKKSIKKQDSKISDKIAERIAFATATKRWQEKYKKNPSGSKIE